MNDQHKESSPDTQKTGDTKPVSTADMVGTPERNTATGTDAMYRQSGSSGTGQMKPTPLFTNDQTQTYRSRWTTIQTSFVDEPRHAVEQADTLVAELMQELARNFASEKDKLETQWGQGQEASTEDLRISMQHYRSFFDRLLSL